MTQEQQARYLLELRKGTPKIKAANVVGVPYKDVKNFRKNSPVFDEACYEALEEADEAIHVVLREAALRGEGWAIKVLSEKWGWKAAAKIGETNVTNNFLSLEGNPLEKIKKIQEQVAKREALPKAIDVSLAE